MKPQESPTPRSPTGRLLSGWGRLAVPGEEVVAEDLEEITADVPLTRGLGRSYGDSSLPPPGHLEVAGSRLADRILGFDPVQGLLRAEAGLTLADINRLFWPRGWSSPVLPGTKFVTLGGMVAADVHGKNHHAAGTFGAHVESLRMRVADGRVLQCSRRSEEELFQATLGGMGLTGHVLEVTLKLTSIPSPWIWQESERIPGLDRFLEALTEAANDWPYTVGWIDCLKKGRGLGRGILIRGRWAEPAEAPAKPPAPKRRFVMPFELPSGLLNRATVSLFNNCYYWRHVRRHQRGISHPESFFHPLDAILDWNRIYGRRGFTQYQCVIPAARGAAGVRRVLELLGNLGVASFLSVIKDCGAEGEGMLSFPCRGTTLALDVPVGPRVQEQIDQLNECVLAEGGRIYLAKDTFTRAEHFQRMEPRLEAWQAVRHRWDPKGRLSSAQSVRLFGN